MAFGSSTTPLGTCNIWDVLGRQALLFGHVECTFQYLPFEAAAIATLHSHTTCTASSSEKENGWKRGEKKRMKTGHHVSPGLYNTNLGRASLVEHQMLDADPDYLLWHAVVSVRVEENLVLPVLAAHVGVATHLLCRLARLTRPH